MLSRNKLPGHPVSGVTSETRRTGLRGQWAEGDAGEWKIPASTPELGVFCLPLQHPNILHLLPLPIPGGFHSWGSPTSRDQREAGLSALPLLQGHRLAASLHQGHLPEASSTCSPLLFRSSSLPRLFSPRESHSSQGCKSECEAPVPDGGRGQQTFFFEEPFKHRGSRVSVVRLSSALAFQRSQDTM